MKAYGYILAILLIMCITAGCGKKDEVSEVMADRLIEQSAALLPEDVPDEAKKDVTVSVAEGSPDEALPEVMAPPSPSVSNEDNEEQDAALLPPETGTEGIDVDLTALSSTMVYSQVFNMMASPESFVGKTVKMKGMFSSFHDEEKDKTYFACIISDATACCSQGIEFVLTEDYSYPEDYPPEGDDICVEGVFDTYEEDDYTYYTLRNARIVG